MNDPILLIEHGRLTGDPEMKTTKTGKQILQFTVAGNGFHKDKNTGQYVDDCQIFIRCTEWDVNRAQALQKSCTRVAKCVWKPLSTTVAVLTRTGNRACISTLDSRRLPCTRPVRRRLSNRNSRTLVARRISMISAIVTLGVKPHFENQNVNV